MVAESGENWDVGERIHHLLDSQPEQLEVALFGLVPDVVGRNVASPNDVVYVLNSIVRKGKCVMGKRGLDTLCSLAMFSNMFSIRIFGVSQLP